ncbi:hypothetical protein BDN70DRAFT_900739 [Pholiota conissans]|uniref:Uncharacterized protein n=1 Tax=Pholiota conissans TaxID=109636 RepID=A0A9P5YQN3_9AGAR|nr:hypothetical protein BDN70DRAFT_900739 [Pholiota conissans]
MYRNFKTHVVSKIHADLDVVDDDDEIGRGGPASPANRMPHGKCRDASSMTWSTYGLPLPSNEGCGLWTTTTNDEDAQHTATATDSERRRTTDSGNVERMSKDDEEERASTTDHVRRTMADGEEDTRRIANEDRLARRTTTTTKERTTQPRQRRSRMDDHRRRRTTTLTADSSHSLRAVTDDDDDELDRRLDGVRPRPRRTTWTKRATADEKDGKDMRTSVPSIPPSSPTVCPHVREGKRVRTDERARREGNGRAPALPPPLSRPRHRRLTTEGNRRRPAVNRRMRVDALVLLFSHSMFEARYSNLSAKKGRIVQKRQTFVIEENPEKNEGFRKFYI